MSAITVTRQVHFATRTPKIRPGGLIAGHDIRWPTVRRAVAASGPFEEAGHDQVWLRWIR